MVEYPTTLVVIVRYGAEMARLQEDWHKHGLCPPYTCVPHAMRVSNILSTTETQLYQK